MKMTKPYGKKLLLLKPGEIMLPLFPIKTSLDADSVRLLADSVSANGIIEPLIVRKNRLGRFELVSGYRRLRAAITVGLRRVPCVLIFADELSAALISVSENLNRSSPDYFEQAEFFRMISVRFGIDYPLIAEKTGISSSRLEILIGLLSLKESVRQRLLSAGLDERYAFIVSMVGEDDQPRLIDKIVSLSLTPERAKEAVREYIFPKPPEPKGPSDTPPGLKSVSCDVRLFSNSLSKLIKTLTNSGIAASSEQTEKDGFIEYTIRIPKTHQSAREQSDASPRINPVCSFVP